MKVTNLEKCVERILEEQTKDGLFPTYKSKNKSNFSIPIEQETATKTENLGLHSFVIEKLIRLFKNNPKAISSFKHGIKVILDDAIKYDDNYLWRWLKNPDRADYLYPPDHDDTARAIAIIETAKEYMPEIINYFEKHNKYPYELVNQNYTKILLKDLFWIGNDFKPMLEISRKEKGIFTFARNYGFKEHNEIDPVVNSTVLYSYLLYLKNKRKKKDEIVKGIRAYLTKFVLSEQFNQDFENISRFYLSHSLFSNIFTDINRLDRKLFSKKVKNCIIEKMKNYSARNVLEIALTTGALLKIGYNGKEVKKGIEEIIDTSKDRIWEAYPFYQHKRLNHVFGSRAVTSVFCLESIKLLEAENEQ
ncbi:hypothetical protein AYK26_06640 [Euryarchaeota archaeon SM23-78]|nr:MAG: hypothetical protein AYK26_06640 [Euryarchaeota archaeon SM23-78]MBW3000942.1 hypothetical protein [Candidatus Woesearchaeota archaeon]